MEIKIEGGTATLIKTYWELDNWADRTDKEYINAMNSLRILIEKELTHEVLDTIPNLA